VRSSPGTAVVELAARAVAAVDGHLYGLDLIVSQEGAPAAGPSVPTLAPQSTH
jgi:hypothetical protein